MPGAGRAGQGQRLGQVGVVQAGAGPAGGDGEDRQRAGQVVGLAGPPEQAHRPVGVPDGDRRVRLHERDPGPLEQHRRDQAVVVGGVGERGGQHLVHGGDAGAGQLEEGHPHPDHLGRRGRRRPAGRRARGARARRGCRARRSRRPWRATRPARRRGRTAPGRRPAGRARWRSRGHPPPAASAATAASSRAKSASGRGSARARCRICSAHGRRDLGEVLVQLGPAAGRGRLGHDPAAVRPG